MYRISVYIKADNSFGDEMIISFHEDNIRGVAKTNSLIKNTKDRIGSRNCRQFMVVINREEWQCIRKAVCSAWNENLA